MNNTQLDIYDMLYEPYKITKPIRLIEFFAGYGSQALALKYLGVHFEHWKTCEWAVKSIQAYKDIHFNDAKVDLDLLMDKKQMVDFLYNKGISSNYNEPMSKSQISRLSEEQLKTIINNIFITNNLVNIQQVKGKDLEIVDKEHYTYLLTYSFPCQDLSLAGQGKGMSDTNTRSGMLWEVERILKECKELGTLPNVLLMENVPQVHGVDNVQDFNKWHLALEEMGYKNYFQDLIGTDYGIPQTRNRCFMVSILGDYNYKFPPPIPLKLKLKDLLEDNVDKKYFLSKKMLKCFIEPSESGKNFGRDKQFLKNLDNVDIAQTITTAAGNRATDNFIRCIGTYQYAKSDNFMQGKDRFQLGKDTSDTLQTTQKEGIVYEDLRIRKLTPREVFRLMGVKDEDFENCAKNQSDASLFHLAGDSIIVDVLMAIFKQMLLKEGDE